MKTLQTLSAVIAAAALFSAAPFSLRFSPERIVSLSMDTAAALMPGGGVPKRRDLGNGTNTSHPKKGKKHNP
jgi:hypothetical protein